MGLVINTNTTALTTLRYLNGTNRQLSRSIERLATGFRINRAADDAAGLQVSETLRAQLRGLEQASRNTQDGVSLLNTADGSLGSVTDDLQRIRELAVQGANDTLSASQRSALNTEITQLATNVTQTATATTFNNRNLFNGSISTLRIQTGANATQSTNTIDLASIGGVNPFANLSAGSLGLGNNGALLGVGTNASARATLSRVDAALSTLNNRRTAIGAASNRLEAVGNNLAIQAENVAASESRIRNVDVARETVRLTQFQILQQAGISVLAQANQSSTQALNLF